MFLQIKKLKMKKDPNDSLQDVGVRLYLGQLEIFKETIEKVFSGAPLTRVPVDITVEIDEEEFFITNINKLKGKLQFYGKTLIMQWYNIDDSAKENFENFIMATLGK